jgi:two-component system cell cycle response regulator
MEKQTILVVDDEKLVIELLTDLLETEFEVITADNGEQAIQQLKKYPVSMVISDVAMPGMDGFELCGFIKRTGSLSHIPVILLTAKAELENKIQGLHWGADVYVEKPFSPDFLKAQVVSTLQNRTRVQDFLILEKQNRDAEESNGENGERSFISQLHAIIDEFITDPLLDLEFLARHLHMSRASLYRKIKTLTPLTPYEIVEQRRLRRATDLIQKSQYKMNEIAIMSGYNSASQFTKSFKRKFGQSPLHYARNRK